MQWIESKHFTQPTYFNSTYAVFKHIFEDINVPVKPKGHIGQINKQAASI